MLRIKELCIHNIKQDSEIFTVYFKRICFTLMFQIKMKQGKYNFEMNECPICYENKSYNLILNCQHMFCVNCIYRMKKHSQNENNLTCPLCRKNII